MSQTPNIKLPWQANAIIIAGVIIVGGIAFFVIKKNIKNIQNTQDAKKEVKSVDDAVKKLVQSGKKPTLDAVKLNGIANSIFIALDGYTSDEQAVYRAFANVNNDIDVLSLIKAFGVREISSGAGNPEPNTKGTLSQVLTDELSAAEIKALNDMLARKGITYRF